MTGKENSLFDTFLNDFKESLKVAFYEIDDIERFSKKRRFPAAVLNQVLSTSPLSVAVPSENGGRGVKVKECLSVLEASSYESLSLSLIFGINIALFLEPLGKYGQEEIKKRVFKKVLTQKHMGGLMITEPGYGSDALNMQTFNQKSGNHYHIKGTKHWQGLTGMANYWLMTCRNKSERGNLGRDLDFFITEEHDENQKIKVLEYFDNIGLYPIPYGLNDVDIMVPEENKLVPESTGLKLIMDLLHRSRLQFPGMAMGFLRRMLDDSLEYCQKRFVGGKPLFQLDSVSHQIGQIQSAFTICSAMCLRSSNFSGIDNNLAGDAIEANSMKAYITDLMQMAAQTAVQVHGAKGYKEENVAARGIMDSRPFRIFEGSNEMLYSQIAEMVLKKMTRMKVQNLYEYLSSNSLTEVAIDHFKNVLSFTIDNSLSQRKMVDLGRIISRVVSANMVFNLGISGFRKDLIGDCLEHLKHDVLGLVSTYKNHTSIKPIADYKANSGWLNFI
ncbi:MAG: acyl-CoA dehydrogenase family protein [Saprospiraceae bacterium]